MNLVTLEGVRKQYSERLLLDDVELKINVGDRICLIGPNGCGKSTLLRIITGEETADAGKIVIWGGVQVQSLAQEPALDDTLTVLEQIYQSPDPRMHLLREYDRVSLLLQADPSQADVRNRLSDLSADMDRTGAWAAEANARTIYTRLGISDFDARIGALSGGQRKRVALAHALITPADLLILDEPTNHVDAETIDWLETFLVQRSGALLMVTHDRYFLERVANRIVTLEGRKLINYPGNYSQFLEQSNRRKEQMAGSERKRLNLLRRELAWLRRGATARGTKQKARKQRIEELWHDSPRQDDGRIAISLASRRLGKKVLAAAGLSKTYGDLTLFRDLDFFLEPGDRIGVIGPNGSGKSTFLDILAGKTAPDTGEVEWGTTVHLAYFDQQSAGLPNDRRVLDFIEEKAALIRTPSGERFEAAQVLEWFLFSRAEQQAWIASLSGGERRRLYLLYCLMGQPNVLFLDEPTNDLDLETLYVLEQFLDHYAGALVIVSHDRFFLDRNVDFYVSFEEGVLGSRIPGPYESFAASRQVGPPAQPAATARAAGKLLKPGQDRPRRLSWKERQELERLEGEIGRLSESARILEHEINHSGEDYERLRTLAAELERLQVEQAGLEERWLELTIIGEGE